MTMVAYLLLRVFKFLGVMLLAGGAVASFVVSAPSDRKRAVHGIGSRGLVLTWTAGYLLSLTLGVRLSELWTLAGLALSFVAHLALLASVNRERSLGRIAAVAGPLLAVLFLMVFRPTWSMVLR